MFADIRDNPISPVVRNERGNLNSFYFRGLPPITGSGGKAYEIPTLEFITIFVQYWFHHILVCLILRSGFVEGVDRAVPITSVLVSNFLSYLLITKVFHKKTKPNVKMLPIPITADPKKTTAVINLVSV